MVTKRKTVQNILDLEAEYFLVVKENQDHLKKNVESAFLNQNPDSRDISVEKGHVRIDTRTCEMINTLELFDLKEQWAALRSLDRINTQRENRDTNTIEVRL